MNEFTPPYPDLEPVEYGIIAAVITEHELYNLGLYLGQLDREQEPVKYAQGLYKRIKDRALKGGMLSRDRKAMYSQLGDLVKKLDALKPSPAVLRVYRNMMDFAGIEGREERLVWLENKGVDTVNNDVEEFISDDKL